MRPPVLITPPATPVVTLADLKKHLSIEADETEDDTLIAGFEASAVAELDGWNGRLGRCIGEQQWRQTFDCWGTELRLVFPDISAVEVMGYDADDNAVAPDSYKLDRDACGFYVTATGAAVDRVEVTMTCGLPDTLLPSAHKAIRTIVAREYMDREGLEDLGPYDRAIERAVGQLVWITIT